MPQSNQRGIETDQLLRAIDILDEPQSNQRGIETAAGDGARPPRGPPQSNQRGIETSSRFVTSSAMSRASIEPAWD